MLLIVVDVYSKWLEVCVMGSTTAPKTIVTLRDMFARYGLPQQVVSDNGPQFSAVEFENFLSTNGIKLILISPYHPSSSGAAERAVQTVKRALRALITLVSHWSSHCPPSFYDTGQHLMPRLTWLPVL